MRRSWSWEILITYMKRHIKLEYVSSMKWNLQFTGINVWNCLPISKQEIEDWYTNLVLHSNFKKYIIGRLRLLDSPLWLNLYIITLCGFHLRQSIWVCYKQKYITFQLHYNWCWLYLCSNSIFFLLYFVQFSESDIKFGWKHNKLIKHAKNSWILLRNFHISIYKSAILT